MYVCSTPHTGECTKGRECLRSFYTEYCGEHLVTLAAVLCATSVFLVLGLLGTPSQSNTMAMVTLIESTTPRANGSARLVSLTLLVPVIDLF
jgi:hypothetical protein